MTTTADRSRNKLPVWATAGEAMSTLFSQFIALLVISWPWLLLAGCFSYYSSLVMADWLGQVVTSREAPQVQMEPPANFAAFSYLQNLLTLVAGAVMAVGWHRLVLIGERASFASTLPGWPALRYLGALMLLMLTISLPGLVAWGVLIGSLFLYDAPGAMHLIAVPIIFLLTIAASVAGIRMSMVLPARSIGDNTLRLRDSWSATRGNSMRLLLGAFLAFVLPLLLAQLFALPLLLPSFGGAKLDPTQHLRTMAIPFAVLTMLYMIASMVFVGFLSFSYKHFFPDRLADAARR